MRAPRQHVARHDRGSAPAVRTARSRSTGSPRPAHLGLLGREGYPGNRVLARQVRLLRAYEASRKQRTELTKLVERRWGKAIAEAMTDATTVVDTLIETNDSHIDAKATAENLSFEAWNWGEAKESNKKQQTADPLAKVRGEIKKASLELSEFKTSDLEQIELLAKQPQVGYQAAIRQVWTGITQARENERLRIERVNRYQQSYSDGQAVFATPLLALVWGAAYSVATAGDANKNASVSGLWPDAQILPAVNTWRRQGDIGEVGNFHVPGGTTPIEDKSLRGGGETRGRQADFISAWGGGNINIHVDADPQHL